MLSLGILSNDLLDLKEESEDLTMLTDSDDEGGVPTTKKRVEGEAFSGTLLGSSSFLSSAPPSSSQSSPPAAPCLACPACTYENDLGDVACAMCDTPLDNTT